MTSLRGKQLPVVCLGAVLAVFAVVAALVLGGCERMDPGLVAQALPPETTLIVAEAHRGLSDHSIHFVWSGEDPDGAVVGFLVDRDAEGWVRVATTDSVVVVPCAELEGTSGGPVKHTFSVRAVDEDGLEDPTPASLSFTGRNILPETEITAGPSGITGPMVNFEWHGWDADGYIAGYEYELYLWESYQWFLVFESGPLGPEETSVIFGPIAGRHRFDVWSIDNEGGIDPTPASREFISNPELAGARLTIKTNFVGTHVFRGVVWPQSYNDPTPILEEPLLTFGWVASAEDYGGQIVGYSYAYDDTIPWPAWSLESTHFDVPAELGEHSVYVRVLDNANVITRARICYEVYETTLSEYVLVVDDYDWHEEEEPWGTDVDRDAFYETLTGECVRPVVQWDALEHMVGGVPQPPDIETLAGASSVIWYVDHETTSLTVAFDDVERAYVALGGYVRVGGNLILCGFEPIAHIVGEPYPINVTSADTTAGRAFVRDVLGVGFAESSGTNADKAVPWEYGYCFYGADAGGTGVPESRVVDLEPMYIDSVGVGGYPEPGKWPVYTWPEHNYSRCGLPRIERIEPYGCESLVAFEIDAFLNMGFDDRPCMVLSYTGTGRGNVCYMSHPLYYLQTPQVVAVFDKLLPLFGEEMR
jgi:hypothetical protein